MLDTRQAAHTFGYCTNVHPGATLEAAIDQLTRHAVEVRRRLQLAEELPLGLWLSAASARAILETDRLSELADRLSSLGLRVFTLNGFPWGDFHARRVKHRVYRPDWSDVRRWTYTLDLARILAGLLPPGAEGSISTLPLGWQQPDTARATVLEAAAARLACLAVELERIEETTGRHIHVDLEPEPGCLLDTSQDVVAFFSDFLRPRGRQVTRYLGVCHDVCHAAVMFEEQAEVLERYRDAGIRVGKVQISNAPRVDFARLGSTGRRRAWARLRELQEDRYLHQTTVYRRGRLTLYDDLPEALQDVDGEPRGEWRVHLHVPIDLEDVGGIGTTRDEIRRCLAALRDRPECRFFEVETYAWGVLPQDLQRSSLAEGIAGELGWLQSHLTRRQAA